MMFGLSVFVVSFWYVISFMFCNEKYSKLFWTESNDEQPVSLISRYLLVLFCTRKMRLIILGAQTEGQSRAHICSLFLF